MAQPFLHPALDGGLRSGPGTIGGGTLRCRCPSERVEVSIAGDVAHNHACGCSQCWKPEGALFSVVGVVPADDLKVTAHEEKLDVVDPSATIRRHACRQCGVHMYGRIVKDHAFRGLDFVHVELSDDEGWQPPQFAGFVSSIIEQGYRPEGMEAVRARFKALGLPTYDCLSPPLMDAIAGFAAKQALRMSSKSIPAEAAAAPRLDSSRTASASIPGGPARPPAGDAAMKKPSGVKGFLAKLFGG